MVENELGINFDDDLASLDVRRRLVHTLTLPFQLDADDDKSLVDVLFDLMGFVGGEDDCMAGRGV
jgi:hypothetical protein